MLTEDDHLEVEKLLRLGIVIEEFHIVMELHMSAYGDNTRSGERKTIVGRLKKYLDF